MTLLLESEVGDIGQYNPLYIVDGVPTQANINMFSTNDIESIEVLKMVLRQPFTARVPPMVLSSLPQKR